MEIFKNAAVLLKLRNPDRVTEVIPKSKKVGDKVVVNWGVDETRVLKNLDINVPSPILGQYKWSGNVTPYSHQKTTSSFLTLHQKAFCFNEQGTGKTAECWWCAHCRLWTVRGDLTCSPSLCTARWT